MSCNIRENADPLSLITAKYSNLSCISLRPFRMNDSHVYMNRVYLCSSSFVEKKNVSTQTIAEHPAPCTSEKRLLQINTARRRRMLRTMGKSTQHAKLMPQKCLWQRDKEDRSSEKKQTTTYITKQNKGCLHKGCMYNWRLQSESEENVIKRLLRVGQRRVTPSKLWTCNEILNAIN